MPDTATIADPETSFRDRLARHGMRPLWDVLHALVPKEPMTNVVAARWRYAEVEPCLAEAGRMISAEKAERRVLISKIPLCRASRESPRRYMPDCS